jgi:hypothetical protein
MNQRVSIPEEAVEAASSHAAIRMMEARAAVPIIRQQAARDRITVELGDSELRDEIEEAGVELATKYDIELWICWPGKGPTPNSIRQQALAEAKARVEAKRINNPHPDLPMEHAYNRAIDDCLRAIQEADDE